MSLRNSHLAEHSFNGILWHNSLAGAIALVLFLCLEQYALLGYVTRARLLGGFLFLVQGILIHNMPLLITNMITATCSAIIFGIKIYNDYIKKK